MLLACVIVYLLATLALGAYASRKVRTEEDFILAGRNLPMFMATATVFATWFGSETILGASKEMAEHGLLGVIEDPFGAALCLILVGFFFARPLYRQKYNTFADFYRQKFGAKAEFFASICLVLSYFGWVAAQMVAMGLVLQQISGLDLTTSVLTTSLVVVIYTFLGGMWAISITDSVQMVIIILGLVVTAALTLPQAGGFSNVIANMPKDHLRLLPDFKLLDILTYIAAWLTLGLGSIPQQDVFQRVMASKNEKVAARSTIIAGLMYLSIALVPLLLGVIARQILPLSNADSPLTVLVIEKTNLVVQIFFFGSLLAAIMSTASGALLAPAAILSENLIKPHLKNVNDKSMLKLSRMSVVILAIISLGFATYKQDIYELVAEASALSLVSLFVPLVAGLFLKSTNQMASIASMLCGLFTWLATFIFVPKVIPGIFWGLAASVLVYLFVSLLTRFDWLTPKRV